MLFSFARRVTCSRTRLNAYYDPRRHFSLLRNLEGRGFVQQVTSCAVPKSIQYMRLIQIYRRSEHFDDALRTSKQTIYCGIDPTAPSLHIGHLFPLMCLLQFHLHGHNTISLVRSTHTDYCGKASLTMCRLEAQLVSSAIHLVEKLNEMLLTHKSSNITSTH